MKLSKKLLREALTYGNPQNMRPTNRGGIEHDGKHYYAAARPRQPGDRLIYCSNVNIWRGC
jgi:hypothetical protein